MEETKMQDTIASLDVTGDQMEPWAKGDTQLELKAIPEQLDEGYPTNNEQVFTNNLFTNN